MAPRPPPPGLPCGSALVAQQYQWVRRSLVVLGPLLLVAAALSWLPFTTRPSSARRSQPSPGGGDDASVLSTALRATRQFFDAGAPRCELDEPGWWDLNASAAPAQRWAWRTARPCTHSIATFDDFVEAFQGRTITLIGDSTARAAFFAFSCALLRCHAPSDVLGPRERGAPGEPDPCEHCDEARLVVPSAVLRLGARYRDITLRFYWLSWMDTLTRRGPLMGPEDWDGDWRSQVDEVPREYDPDALLHHDVGDFVVMGVGLWELKFPGSPYPPTQPAAARAAALAYFEASLRNLTRALAGTRLGGELAETGRFVFRGLPAIERGGPTHARARAAAGHTGPLTYPH